MDFSNFYMSFPLASEARKFLAFNSPVDNQRYEYCRVPFGIKTVGNFASMVTDNIYGQNNENCFIFVDDAIRATNTIDHHFELLEDFFKRTKDVNLVIKSKKCTFFIIYGLILERETQKTR